MNGEKNMSELRCFDPRIVEIRMLATDQHADDHYRTVRGRRVRSIVDATYPFADENTVRIRNRARAFYREVGWSIDK